MTNNRYMTLLNFMMSYDYEVLALAADQTKMLGNEEILLDLSCAAQGWPVMVENGHKHYPKCVLFAHFEIEQENYTWQPTVNQGAALAGA